MTLAGCLSPLHLKCKCPIGPWILSPAEAFSASFTTRKLVEAT